MRIKPRWKHFAGVALTSLLIALGLLGAEAGREGPSELCDERLAELSVAAKHSEEVEIDQLNVAFDRCEVELSRLRSHARRSPSENSAHACVKRVNEIKAEFRLKPKDNVASEQVESMLDHCQKALLPETSSRTLSLPGLINAPGAVSHHGSRRSPANE